jgi:hypothetical protein
MQHASRHERSSVETNLTYEKRIRNFTGVLGDAHIFTKELTYRLRKIHGSLTDAIPACRVPQFINKNASGT